MVQKEKIWMFGDSYGDAQSSVDPNSFSWVRELHKSYDVLNFCMKGTGADYTISNFIEKVDNIDNDLKDTDLIFIIPFVYRFNFSFFRKVSDQALITYIIDDDDTPTKDDTFNKSIKLYKKQYGDFINKFFKYYLYFNDDNNVQRYANDTIHKIIGSISLYSQLFKSVLCFIVNDKPTTNINNLINNDNFYFVDEKLFDISNAEINSPVEIYNKIGEDPRNNHLNEHNNKVMFEQITKWINDKKPFDITKFNN